MTLLTVAQFREHAATTLVDDAIQRLLDDAEAEITAYAGPVGSVTEYPAGGGSILTLSRRVSSVGSIAETRYSTTTTLAVDDWRQRSGYTLERLRTGTNPRTGWASDVTVTYTPADDTATRKMVQLELCKLEIATNPGLASQTVGAWTEQYTANSAWNPEEARASILSRLREPSMAVVD